MLNIGQQVLHIGETFLRCQKSLFNFLLNTSYKHSTHRGVFSDD